MGTRGLAEVLHREARILVSDVVSSQLIDCGKLGDTNERAMRMADFWLTEKDLIPKLFQVLAPRYQGQNGGYTRMLQIPNPNQQDRAKMAVIEYKVNCLLPIARRDSNLTLLNQLLQGLRAAEPGSKHPQLPPSSNTRGLTEAKGHVAPISAHDHRPWELY